MTQRSAFVLRVRPDSFDEYVKAHREVWPEMLDALRGAGIRNYSIFRAGNEMFGYFEADDLDAAERYLASKDVCTRWQDAMAHLLEERVPDGGPPNSKRCSGSNDERAWDQEFSEGLGARRNVSTAWTRRFSLDRSAGRACGRSSARALRRFSV